MSHRVLMTADAVGGVWAFAIELARALAMRGGRVSLAVMGPPASDAQRAEAKLVPRLDLHERPCQLEWMDDPWDDVREAGPWLLDLERRVDPEVIHLNGYCHGALPWRAPVVMTAHSCVLSWWRAVHGHDAPGRWSRYAAEVARGLRAATLVTAPTAAMLAELEACYGPLPRTQVIANGRSAGAIPPEAGSAVPRQVDGHGAGSAPLPGPPRRGPARAGTRPADLPRRDVASGGLSSADLPPRDLAGGTRLGDGGKEPLVLTAGRLWDEAKNVGALCAAAPRIAWPVFVAGDPGRAPRPESEHVHVLGYLPPADLACWMGRAAIYALPARYEPFGLSAVEAALAGCALVLGDIRSLREVWGDAALYVRPADHDGLSAVLSRLIEDEALRREMGRRACTRARQLTPDRMARGYDEAYRRLVADRAAYSGQGSRA